MKKVFISIVILIAQLAIWAQSPQSFNYQAVLRDASGKIKSDKPVVLQIDLLQGAANGFVTYSESFSDTTNGFGLINLAIGKGSVIKGTFNTISWANGPFFLRLIVDGTEMGTSQLLSVPYALYAEKAGNSFSGSFNDLNDKPTTLDGYGITDAAIKAYVDAFQAQIEELQFIAGIKTKDIDGNYYGTVKIGTQLWMKENLKTTRYNNGDLIGTTSPATLSLSESTPKYQWPCNGNESNVAAYGRLYTWYVLNDSRDVCPVSWHVPSDAEWTILTDYLTNNGYGYEGSGNDIAKSMASTSGWTYDNIAGHVGNDQLSNNTSGFSALPVGIRYSYGAFQGPGSSCFWWTSTEFNASSAWQSWIYNGSIIDLNDYPKNVGLPVRCLKD